MDLTHSPFGLISATEMAEEPISMPTILSQETFTDLPFIESLNVDGAKSHKPVLFFIPKLESERPQAVAQSKRCDGLPWRHCIMALFQMVVGNSRAYVVNVMEPDVARKPLQQSWQAIERRALQCSLHWIPRNMARPVNPLELMLDVKQPNAASAGDNKYGKLDQQIGLPSDKPGSEDKGERNACVGDVQALDLLSPFTLSRKSLID